MVMSSRPSSLCTRAFDMPLACRIASQVRKLICLFFGRCSVLFTGINYVPYPLADAEDHNYGQWFKFILQHTCKKGLQISAHLVLLREWSVLDDESIKQVICCGESLSN